MTDGGASTLSRLVPLLGSPHDGEVIAAARAIERKLRSEGRDWHWIAQCVVDADVSRTEPFPPPPRHYNPEHAHPEYRPRKPKEPGWEAIRHSERISWMSALKDLDWLSDADRMIVRDMHRKLHVGVMIDITPQMKRAVMRLVRKAKKMGLAPSGC